MQAQCDACGTPCAAAAQVWDHLHLLSSKYPVEGNKDGTYLTFFSIGGFIFGIINIIGNFGTVFNDQARSKPYRLS